MPTPANDHTHLQSRGANLSVSRPRILFVEDNEVQARAVIRELRAGGYDVMQVRSSKEATAVLQCERFSLVIVDGALEDGRREANGAAARLIRASLGSIPYGRLSSHPELIPESLHGKFCLDKNNDLPKLMESLEREVPHSIEGTGASIPPPDFSKIQIPVEAQLAVVVAHEKLHTVDDWLAKHGVTVRLMSARHNYLLVDDLAPETIRALAHEFGAEVRPATEMRAPRN